MFINNIWLAEKESHGYNAQKLDVIENIIHGRTYPHFQHFLRCERR